MLHKLTLGDMDNNCYILADGATGQAIVVDAPARADLIMELIRQHNYHVSDIILTHGHYDHILALPDLKKETNARVVIHQNGKAFLEDSSLNLCAFSGHNWIPMNADRYVKDGDMISLGNAPIHILHTPGHTSDSISLLWGNDLLCGDTLFRFNVGRADLPTGNLTQELRSIKEKLMPLADNVRVYPGHGPATTIGEERRENPYLK